LNHSEAVKSYLHKEDSLDDISKDNTYFVCFKDGSFTELYFKDGMLGLIKIKKGYSIVGWL
jgi:hypothetical protein